MNKHQAGRVDWVDYAKGFCIVMVVMMHSTLGVEAAAGREGWMHALVAFAKPFRMPDFFLISGLFLARVIDRDWRDYLDKKVVHFAYFYVLWVTIQFAFKAPMFAAEMGWRGVGFAYLEAFIEPFGTLWFIYLLPIFFVVVKLTRSVPWIAIWLIGAALEIAPIHTGWTVIDEFAQPLRLLLLRLHLRHAHLRFRRGRAARASGCDRRSHSVGHRQRRAGVHGLWRPAVHVARSRLRRCGGGRGGRGADGEDGRVPVAALLRGELHRHLSRLLPADGRDPHGPAQDRRHHRPRHHLADCDNRRRDRRARLVLGGALDAAPLPVRAAGLGASSGRARAPAMQPAE